jgi:NADPH:quinone reductase-like Zn-dependent oxidoreductase
MYAAVVTTFDAPPSYQEFPTPTPNDSDEVLVDVVASGLHRRVRSEANGSHYTSTGDLPLVPGVDGVGRMPDGTLRYFALGDTTSGAMAEQTVIDLRRSFALPEGTDPVLVAAAMNPAMSSWVALRRRISFQAGQTVLVLGATGSSGQMAVQVAKRLGAGRVIAAGRNPERLAELPGLGADTVVRLGDSPGLGEVAARSAGSRSARSPDRPPRSRRRHCAPCRCRSSEAGKARFPPPASWPNCLPWSAKSAAAPYVSMSALFRFAMSRRPGRTPAAPSGLC